jgi:hypothetical protein
VRKSVHGFARGTTLYTFEFRASYLPLGEPT